MKKITLPLTALFGLMCLVSMALWLLRGRAPGELAYDVQSKKSVMTFAYKAYANPTASEGKYYLSKTVFTNKGQGAVRNLLVSYNVPEYISWTTPEKYEEVQPGQTVVALFYPMFPQRVSAMTSPTTATLEIKMSWDDGSGKPKEEVVKRNFLLRGVNEIEYTSIPENEIATWFDRFENDDLSAAMVTPDDPVVKALVAEINKFAGGTTAGIAGGAKEVLRVMEVFYNYQVATGMHYVSSKWMPEDIGDVKTCVQNVRLPREVIMNNGGLCIELALLWSSVMDHLGVKSYIVCVPGHAFAMMLDEQSGALIPFECTGINGPGIGRSLSFKEALKAAEETKAKYERDGRIKFLDVRALHQKGIRPPELPAMDMKLVEETLAKRLQGGGRQIGQRENAPRQDNQRFAHPQGLFAFEFPQSFQQNAALIQQVRSVAPFWIYSATDPMSGISVEAYHWPRLGDANAAVKDMQRAGQYLGARIEIQSTEGITIGSCAGCKCTGSTTGVDGRAFTWTGLFLVTPKGVVGITSGCIADAYSTMKDTIDGIVDSFQIQ